MTTCPIPGASQTHDHMVDNPKAWTAAIAGVSTFAYYAVPDVVKCKFLRGSVKVAATGLVTATLFHADSSLASDFSDTIEGINKEIQKAEPVTVAAWAVGGALALGVPTILIEKAIYRRAEKKKARGRRFPHVKQALVLGALTGALFYALDKD